MIKKSIFEDDIIAGMQRELSHKNIKQGMTDLSKAVDYLHSAIEIFENNGMTAKADQVLNILSKIATHPSGLDKRLSKIPALEELLEKGITVNELKNISKDDSARTKINNVLYEMGYSPHEISAVIGKNNFMTLEEVKELMPKIQKDDYSYNHIDKLISDSLKDKPVNPGDELIMSSIANDKYTKGLTSEKMIANLKHHGTEFNMADDNNVDVSNHPSFDKDYQKWMDHKEKGAPIHKNEYMKWLKNQEKLNSDLLETDIYDTLEVEDSELYTSEMDFEDEI